jgi:polysaccharide pyruvyl transferase WcaK-like protein
MTARGRTGGKPLSPFPRVGLFGKLGAGNIGNDASMESVLRYLRGHQPQAVVDAMCTGPERVTARHGIDAVPLFWHHRFNPRSRAAATALKMLGTVVDTFRTATWVRRHDVLIVPGAGVLEASLPMLPRGFPYALFLLSTYGKVFRKKVALVSVGAGVINQPVTRWLYDSAARFAFYRSYRDAGARKAMRERGVDVSRDCVHPDLAFAIPAPVGHAVDEQTVAVGVMAYYGTNDERKQADEIYSRYVEAMTRFVLWLIDGGRRVLLIVGDTNGSDDGTMQEIVAEVRARRPDLDPSRLAPAAVSSYADVAQALLPVGSVVAIRYHNVLCALRLSKPTISIGYSPKHDALMADMGLAEFCQQVNTLDVGELTELFTELERRSAELREAVTERNTLKEQLVHELFEELSAVLFPPVQPLPAGKVREPA